MSTARWRELVRLRRTVTGMEDSLRARVRTGDHQAFAAVFDADAGAIYAYALRRTGERTTAEDVVSLTFLEAWRLRARLAADGGPLRPWLYGIATNVLRNTARAARRHRAALGRLPVDLVEPDFSDDVADRDADAGRLAAARAALASLHRGERDVVALVIWAGLDYAGAAEALGVPVGTVRSRLSRARTRLRAAVGADRPDDDREPVRATGQERVGRVDTARLTQEARR